MAKKQQFKFEAPIPGMSLTTPPGNRPWENPPKHTNVEDVIKFYFNKMDDEDRQDQLLDILEDGFPINMLVDSMVTSGVMSGIHTLEAGLLAAPVLSEYMQTLAEIEGVSYTISPEDKKRGMKPTMKNKFDKMLREELQIERDKQFMPQEEEEAPIEELGEESAPAPRGLMARSKPAEDVAEDMMQEGVM
jgi:hypothetical protein